MDEHARVSSVGIVADDLTGANDSAVQFARGGWQARLTLGDIGAVGAAAGSVVAVVTDARAQPAPAARAGTAAAVTALGAAGTGRIFVKIDSTMRGSVAAQVRGALDGWMLRQPGAFAVVCPAYPVMGRTVDGGRLLVNGEGVETTSVGRDPVTPVNTSTLAELLPGSASVAAGADAAAIADRVTALVADGAEIVAADATTDEHLGAIADAIALLGPRAVPVGSAGLAVAMSRVWGVGLDAPDVTPPMSAGPRRVVVVVSSLHDVSREQHDYLLSSASAGSVLTLAPTLETILGGGLDGFLDRELTAAEAPEVIVVLAPAERLSEVAAVDAGGIHPDPTPAARIAGALATITDAVITRVGTGSLVLIGGEGARAVLDRFGATSILVRDSIREGIPLGAIEGGRLHGFTVVTKAGGFGTATTLADILPELLNASVGHTTQGERP